MSVRVSADRTQEQRAVSFTVNVWVNSWSTGKKKDQNKKQPATELLSALFWHMKSIPGH